VTRLYVLPLGSCYVDKGAVLTPGLDVGTWWTIPIVGYLIQSGERNILVDTGMPRRLIEDPEALFGGTEFGEVLKLRMKPKDYVVNRLAELGLAPPDIDTVVATHFHFDHAGNTGDFTGSRIVVQRDCYDDIMSNPGEYYPETYDIPGLTWEIVEGDTVIAPGVTVLKTSGHVPGHASVMVDLPNSGPIILGIDAIYTPDNVDRDNWDAYTDPDAARASAERLQAIAKESGAMLVYGHDPNQWEGLRKTPDYYD